MDLHRLRDHFDARDREYSWAVELAAYAALLGVILLVLLCAGCRITQEYSVSYEQRTRDGGTCRIAWKLSSSDAAGTTPRQ